ncbi:hypothetical protein KK083_24330 [Fulvivirgaceae bacterium PWU4]|uniref:ATP-grasp domain-containing protein n=1 Tax=Chryseosolibacter histidini TaxID=2782349 RepID=A0AAP2DRR7_9BACT|nr:hypothetical protein [Chryseosolibacter histidini]MBT1700037.1 hypothetical protein [Chryseosolibacter histidini]
MRGLEKITRSNFFIKLRNWEYWPFGILQFPLFFYFFWLALRSRSLTFFSASNPGIAMGGMFGESKYDVISKIPSAFVPRTKLILLPATSDTVLKTLNQYGFTFPVIFKPELGERGFMVKKITSAADVESYLKKIRINFLVQDFVDLPLEFGVFYQRYPSQPNGKVVSIVAKEMLSVTGDGTSTLQQLIMKKDRAKLQWKKLAEAYRDRLEEVIPAGQSIELVSIGNHAMGTRFLDGNHLINDRLSSSFDRISKQIDGFYFGRFDVRCASLNDLYEGRVKIMELNGCGAEPAHIYDPAFGLFKAVGVLFRHWKTIFEISRENHQAGVRYLSYREALAFYRAFKKAVQ